MNVSYYEFDYQAFIFGDKSHIWKLSLDKLVSIVYVGNQKNENSFQENKWMIKQK